MLDIIWAALAKLSRSLSMSAGQCCASLLREASLAAVQTVVVCVCGQLSMVASKHIVTVVTANNQQL